MTTGSKNLPAIQSLRCIAAVLVVAYHSGLATRLFAENVWMPGDPAFLARHYPAWSTHSGAGVDIFFCISGFIMCLLAERAGAGDAVAVLRDRAIRILPPYWFFTSFIVAIWLVKPGLHIERLSGDMGRDLPVILRSYLLLPQPRSPILGPGWTLIQEFFFYDFVFLVILIGRGRQAAAFIGGAALVGTCLGLAGITVFDGYVPSPYYIEFFAGALMFHLQTRLSRYFPGLQCAAAAALYVGVSSWLDRHLDAPGAMLVQCLGYGTMGALLISGAIGVHARYLAPDGPVARTLSRVGDASYSLYLSHWFVLSLLGEVAGLYKSAPLPVVFVWQATSVVIAIVAAVVFAEQVELPLHRRFSTWLKTSAARRRAEVEWTNLAGPAVQPVN